MDEETLNEEVTPEVTDQITEETTGVDPTPPAEEAAVEKSSGEVAAVETSGIDEETASLAKFYGLDPATYGNDPTRVKQAVSHFDKQLAEFGKSLFRQPEGQPAKTEAEQAKFDLEKLLPPDLNEADYDPAIVGWVKQNKAAIKAVSDHYTQQIEAQKAEYEQRVGALEQRYQAEQEKHFERELDGFFNGIGKEWEGEFGKGDMRALPPHSPLSAARNAVVMDAMALQAGYAHYGQQAPPFPDLMKRALASRYSDKQSTFIRQQLVNEAAAKRPPTSAGASGKRGVPMSGREKAMQTFREGLKQLQSGGSVMAE